MKPELDSYEYMVEVAKAFGLSETGIHSMTITAEFGFPVMVEFKYITFADVRLIKLTVSGNSTSED